MQGFKHVGRIAALLAIIFVVLAFQPRLKTAAAQTNLASDVCSMSVTGLSNCTLTLGTSVAPGGSVSASFVDGGAALAGCSSIPIGVPCSATGNQAIFTCPNGCPAGSVLQEAVQAVPGADYVQQISVSNPAVTIPTTVAVVNPAYPSSGFYSPSLSYPSIYSSAYPSVYNPPVTSYAYSPNASAIGVANPALFTTAQSNPVAAACQTGMFNLSACTLTLEESVAPGGSFTSTLADAGASMASCSSIPAGTPCSVSGDAATFACPAGCAAGSQFQETIQAVPGAGLVQQVSVTNSGISVPTVNTLAMANMSTCTNSLASPFGCVSVAALTPTTCPATAPVACTLTIAPGVSAYYYPAQNSYALYNPSFQSSGYYSPTAGFVSTVNPSTGFFAYYPAAISTAGSPITSSTPVMFLSAAPATFAAAPVAAAVTAVDPVAVDPPAPMTVAVADPVAISRTPPGQASHDTVRTDPPKAWAGAAVSAPANVAATMPVAAASVPENPGRGNDHAQVAEAAGGPVVATDPGRGAGQPPVAAAVGNPHTDQNAGRPGPPPAAAAAASQSAHDPGSAANSAAAVAAPPGHGGGSNTDKPAGRGKGH